MANIQELRAVGAKVVEVAYAVRDGLDLADLAAAQGLVAALLAAADDIKEDVDSALLEIGSGLLSAVAEKRRPPVVP